MRDQLLREKILRRIVRDEATDCWLWQGNVHPTTGYGRVSTGSITDGTRAMEYVHRVSHRVFIGPILEGLTVDHVKGRGCVHRHCCNPAHLEAVSRGENSLRGDSILAQNARKTHCKRNHPLSGENLRTHTRADGSVLRMCRACDRLHESLRAPRRKVTA